MRPCGAGALLLLAVLASCGTPPLRSYESNPGRYDRLSPEGHERLVRARRLWDAGDLDAARVELAVLSTRNPENLTVGVMLQDVELGLLESGASLPGEPADPVPPTSPIPTAVASPADRLLNRYRRRLERARLAPGRSPCAELVLTARLVPDPEEAKAQLEEALSWDAECNWAHYGLAHLLARQGDVNGALEAADQALDLDPGHLPARRLETRLLQRSGNLVRAAEALELWLEDARGDPLIGPREIAEAQLDLATLCLLDDEPGDALELLAGVDREQLGGSSVPGLLEAAAHEARGDPYAALAAAAAAREADPSDPLPLVQMALVQEYRLDDPARAAELWERVAELAKARVLGTNAASSERPLDASALLIWAQARVRVERFEERSRPSP